MKLIRYTHPLHRLREWEALFENSSRVFAPLLATSFDAARRKRDSGVEWFEDEGHFHVRLELPGVKRERLRLDAEEGLLRLSFGDSVDGEADSASATRSEYVVRCPEGVRYEGIEARLADGILQVSLPKQEVRKPLCIEIG